jgi:glycosyltransferase involved in cell wall biosynthesis
MEWIIIDDGTDKIEDLIKASNIQEIKYFPIEKKMKLGAKRNLMHEKTKGSFIVYMDDDDYYPPERVAHAVETLVKNPQALCAGSSELYIYFKHISKMYQSGPFGPTHATAGTFAFRRELLNFTRYEEEACLGEERAFLKQYTVPFVQLDPMKTILVFSHNHNTFDKKIMLNNEHPDFFKESPRKIKEFIKNKEEKQIYRFFLKDIDEKLKNYDLGESVHKPDVLKQIKEIDEKRKNSGPMKVMMEVPGQGKRALSGKEIVDALSNQQEVIKKLTARVQELEDKLKKIKLLAN